MARTVTAIPSPYGERIAQVKAEMARRDLDGYLVENRANQIWLTGFTGEDGLVLLTPRRVVLLTDGRFDETANREAPWARKVLRRKRDPQTTARQIRRYRLSRVGFDPAQTTVLSYSRLRPLIKPARLSSAGGVVSRLRLRKDRSEVEAIRRAIHVAERAYQRVARWIRPGRTEREVAARLVYELQRCGGDGPAFKPIVAVGANAALPHYAPGDAAIRAREAVLIDWGARVGGYVSDLTRVMPIGSIPRDLAQIIRVVREAHDGAISAVRAGTKAASVDRVARKVIQAAGFGERFQHALGHGIGLDVHEGPRLGRNSSDVLEPGMVVTIEPGIYLPGRGGVRIESDVLVTEAGCEVLSTLPY
jgi:Xaa-Pro aminopeptidase